MFVRYLRVLGGLFAVALFVRRGGVPMRFGYFVVMGAGFVVVVLRHSWLFPSFL